MGRFGNLFEQLIEKNQQRFPDFGEDGGRNSIYLPTIDIALSQPTNLGTYEEPRNMTYKMFKEFFFRTGMNSGEVLRTGCKTIIEDTDTSVISGIPLIDDQNSDCYPAAAFNSNNSANFYCQFKLLFKRSVQCTLRDWVTCVEGNINFI